MYEKAPYFYGTGRRKSSVARVRLYQGTGKVTINDRPIDDYFGLETLKLIVRQPLVLTGTDEKFDIVCRVAGGGVTGQAGAIRHGIARALLRPASIMIFDECTSALDISTEHRVIKGILQACTGCTIIFVTHRPAVLTYCTDVIRLS